MSPSKFLYYFKLLKAMSFFNKSGGGSFKKAYFLCDEKIIICADYGLCLLKKDDNFNESSNSKEYIFETVLVGGPYILATSFNGIIAAVAQTASPPFTPFYLLLYQTSGVFVKSIEFPSRILAIESTSQYLFVSIAKSIQVFDLRSFRSISIIENTSSTGFFTVTPQFIAWPDEKKEGTVNLASTFDFKVNLSINCHQTSIKAMKLCSNVLLTASKKGTLIRVFSINNGQLITELRRGLRQAIVMALDGLNDIKCACTSSTVHVFFTDKQDQKDVHLTASPSGNPIACKIINSSRILVLTDDFALTTYEINEETKALQMKNVIIFDIAEALQKKRTRRVTV